MTPFLMSARRYILVPLKAVGRLNLVQFLDRENAARQARAADENL
jgi:hypothetical protein